jgi:hypothetical protein
MCSITVFPRSNQRSYGSIPTDREALAYTPAHPTSETPDLLHVTCSPTTRFIAEDWQSLAIYAEWREAGNHFPR